MPEAAPTLVLFGAGAIGRGFIAPLFCAARWHVIFVDIDTAMVAQLRTAGRYLVHEVSGDHAHPQSIAVAPVSAIDARDRDAVATALAGARLAATAVGLNALVHLGPALAAGLARRVIAGAPPLDVLLCENGLTAGAQLRAAVRAAAGTQAEAVDAALGTVRTSIGRMIPPGQASLDLRVEPYCHLPVDRAGFRGVVPEVDHLDAVTDFDLVLRQKLYLHNLTHAALAFAGAERGYATIPDCLADAALVADVRAAGREVTAALAQAHGGADAGRRNAIADECLRLLDDLFRRYGNRALGDPVTRVARDPLRKLAGDDRLVGAARFCLSHGVAPRALAQHILTACRYAPAADEPGAETFRSLTTAGWRAVLAKTAALTPEEPLMSLLTAAERANRLAAYRNALPARRAEAARAMREAGLVLREDEAAAIEIADFGLGRYAEYGLAIHVYVNTERVCAKELMMTPGQICPEHRHPPIAAGATSEPGQSASEPGQSASEPGKEETFRVRSGEVFLYLPGHKQSSGEREAALARVPADKQAVHTMYRCVHLKPGDQCTLKPNTPHWFVAGAAGAVVSEFSTRSRDEADIFTDPEIVRLPEA